MRKAVFFDLDGTLLPMDNDEFVDAYFAELKKSGVLEILDKDKGMEYFFSSVKYMVGEHGYSSNEEAFCTKLEQLSGAKREIFLPLFEAFYKKHFSTVKKVVKSKPVIHNVLRLLKQKNYTLILATSPVFPQLATDMRIAWAGLDKDDFRYITYYNNCRFTKPNLKYYEELLKQTGFKAHECYMVGNSVTEDLCASELGFEVFLVTDYHVGDISLAPQCSMGTYGDLLNWADGLPYIQNGAV